MKNREFGSVTDIGRRLTELEAADKDSHGRDKLLDLILDVTQVQNDTLISIVLERLGETEGAKDALKEAAAGLKNVIAALRAEHEAGKENFALRKAELASIKAALDEQR